MNEIRVVKIFSHLGIADIIEDLGCEKKEGGQIFNKSDDDENESKEIKVKTK